MGIQVDGDIDSGPVIFGVGFAATIVSIGTHAALGNIRSADDQFNTINAFGFPFQSSNTKSYLFGQLPIADAFIAWSLCGNLMTELTALPFRTPFHLLSLFFIFYGLGSYSFIQQKKRMPAGKAFQKDKR
ncbi:MAG: hypothetical protein IPH36_11985 [Saprospiraceae bacterium]|nr:hypothetical protein [Saprospiraceae bacterium]